MSKGGYDWKGGGEEWSEPWGNSSAQWFGSIFPRIQEWLPAGTILELAPGFGRWTHYLLEHCAHIVLVDLSQECIDGCRRRFAAKSNLSYHKNDGRSLAMIADDSIDFVFSFDSLVHAPRVALDDYLSQMERKLTREGVGFFHHSNLAMYAGALDRRLPKRARKLLTKIHLSDPDHSRVPDMTAEIFRDLCAEHGLKCIRQEMVNWRGRRLLDCISTFVRAGSKRESPLRVWRNPSFMQEAELIRRRAQIYGSAGSA